ncbi:MAG: helix-turn-helix transcriptional regulator [Clostridia bacterium]|nr:helix-turn-helix transcriptional regulator [Clostridia bacterium]
MNLIEVNPYVRFARVQKNIPRGSIVGVDHRIFFCISGEGEITVRERPYSIKPNTFLFVKSGTPYQNTSEADDMILLAYNFDLLCKQENMGAPLSYVKECDYRTDMLVEQRLSENLNGIPEVIYLSDFYKKETFQEIIEEYNHKNIYYNERCGALLKDILICALRSNQEGLASLQKNKGEAILAYVREHFDEPLTNASVAEHFSYHENYLNQLLKKQTGYTLHQYLLEYRINTAISLLRSGEYTVSEVAEQIGFSEIFHFSGCFQKLTGSPPSAYLPAKSKRKKP